MLKTLLVLEAAAKVVLIVRGLLLEEGSLLQLAGIDYNYNHIYRDSAVSVVRLAENYTQCTNADTPSPFLYIVDW